MEAINYGVTMDNSNGRYSPEALEDRVCITATTDDVAHRYYFTIPGLWRNAITDMMALVKKAYPDAEITIDIIG